MSSQANFKKRSQSLLTTLKHNKKNGFLYFFISLFLHGLFFSSMIFFHDFKLPKPMPPVIRIDLVSFSPEPVFEEPKKNNESPQEKSVSVKPTVLQKKSRKIPTIKPDISLKTKPKNLKDLIDQQKKKPNKKEKKKPVEKVIPKKQADPDKELEKARENIEKKVKDQTQDLISQALSRLQQKVKDQDKSKAGAGKGQYARYGKPIDIYQHIMQLEFEQNWVFNDVLARMDQNLEVRILIKILKSGEIRDIIYETRSGNRYLDESAKKAIKKTSPLPPLPAGMHSYDVLIGFTPKGLK